MILLGITLLVMLVLVLLQFRYPFFYRHIAYQYWSVGIGITENIGDALTPETILDFNYIKKIAGVDFIADPFIIKENDKYYLFVEAAIKDFGRIDVLSSINLKDWHYEGVALCKSYHLSYPQVFSFNDKLYMIPESKKGGRVVLYSPVKFPLEWREERTLTNKPLMDTTIVFHDNMVYLFGVDEKYILRCFVSDSLLLGEFVEHSVSPLGVGNRMRPGGRPYYKNSNIIIPVQCNKKGYGYALYSLEISTLTPNSIKYKKGGALLKPFTESDYFKSGVHHLCYLKEDDRSVFVFDGRAGTRYTYWMNNSSNALSNLINDIKTFFIIRKNNFRFKKE